MPDGSPRGSARPSRPAARPVAGPGGFDFDQAGSAFLIEHISLGSVPAFVALFDRTAAAARAELAAGLLDAGRASEILAASYVEVWWLAGCHRTSDVGVIGWITDIVRRRIAEASRGTPPPGERAASEATRPSYAELEVAALLQRPVDRLLRA